MSTATLVQADRYALPPSGQNLEHVLQERPHRPPGVDRPAPGASMTAIKTSLALPAEMVARLDEEAGAAGISRAEVIRRAILAYQDRGDPGRAGEDAGPAPAEGNRTAPPRSACDRVILTAGAVLYLGLGVMAVAIARVLRPGER